MRKIMALVMSLALAFTMIASSPEQAAAFHYDAGGARWQSSSVGFCFSLSNPFPLESEKGTIRAGVKAWNNHSGSSLVVYETTSPCQVTIRYKSLGSSGPLSRADNPVVYNGYIVGPTNIYVNADRMSEVWIYGADQSCYAGVAKNGLPACKSDLFTMMEHEMGHALGFGHNISPDFTYVCMAGYPFLDVEDGCNNSLQFYKIAAMFWSAADGYRRWLSQDDLNAVTTLY